MRTPARSSPVVPELGQPPGAHPAPPRVRRQRSDGRRSHREILRAAADLASVDGLEGLSIATLAGHVGLSKSGLFAHFRSKEELQVETIGMAAEIFQQEVVGPALAAPEGLARVRALVEGFLEHVRRRTFPGGCFFASVAAELDGHPGMLRNRIAAFQREWFALFERSVVQAQGRGELEKAADPTQVAFEVVSMLVGAHGTFLLQGSATALDRGSQGAKAVLASYAPKRSRPRG